MSTRRTQVGGWAKRRRGPCRRCGGEVPRGRFTFCSPECVHEWKLRTDPNYLRAQVFARDRGVCTLCGLDTEKLRKDKRKLDFRARREFEREWGGRRQLWDADHILPVAEGGGECGLSNMRTLCLRCHLAATAALRLRLSSGKKARVGPLSATVPAEVIMPGKKAHKPRDTGSAGTHGVPLQTHGRSRKSEGQTAGQYVRDPKRRTGQYGGAGNPPLIEK